MASLDRLEGDAIEGTGLLLLGLLVFIAYLAYKALGRIPTWDEFWNKFKQWLNSVKPTPGSKGWWGPQWGESGATADIRTGSDVPVVTDQQIVDEMRAGGLSEDEIAQRAAQMGLQEWN